MKAQSNGDLLISKQELEDIKADIEDDTKFRTKVLIELRLLRGLPGRVIRLEVWVVVLWVVSSGIIFTVLNPR